MGDEENAGASRGALCDVIFAAGGGDRPLTLEQMLRFAACDALMAAAALRNMASRSRATGEAVATSRPGFGRVELEDLRNLLEAPGRLVKALMELSAFGEGLEQSRREGVHRLMAEQLEEDERSALASVLGEEGEGS